MDVVVEAVHEADEEDSVSFQGLQLKSFRSSLYLL